MREKNNEKQEDKQ